MVLLCLSQNVLFLCSKLFVKCLTALKIWLLQRSPPFTPNQFFGLLGLASTKMNASYAKTSKVLCLLNGLPFFLEASFLFAVALTVFWLIQRYDTHEPGVSLRCRLVQHTQSVETGNRQRFPWIWTKKRKKRKKRKFAHQKWQKSVLLTTIQQSNNHMVHHRRVKTNYAYHL